MDSFASLFFPSGKSGKTVKGDLHSLCRRGDADAVRGLLASGKAGNVDARAGNLGLTPLHEACSKDQADVCQALLRHGVEVRDFCIVFLHLP